MRLVSRSSLLILLALIEITISSPLLMADAAFVAPLAVSFKMRRYHTSYSASALSYSFCRPRRRLSSSSLQSKQESYSDGDSNKNTGDPTTASTSAEADPSRDILYSPIYNMLATPTESRPGCETFFYNDEVISHLHGYMLLVGLFAAGDELFLVSFMVYAACAAAATLKGYLPANPRVPAVVAVATLLTTVTLRFGLGYEYQFSELGPGDQALFYEVLICALNVAWGVTGSWRTKEKRNGATFGF